MGGIDRKYWTVLEPRGTLSNRLLRDGAKINQGGTMLPLSSRHQQESEAIPKKPPASADLHPEPLLDSDEAAAIMRIHPKTLQRYARQGIVRGLQLGSMWRFRASDIDRWISERLAG
jgi:excisionase family DNA binding protein